MRTLFSWWASLVLAGVLSGCLPELEGAQCAGDQDCNPGLTCNQGFCAALGGALDQSTPPPADEGPPDEGILGDARARDLGGEMGRPDQGRADAATVDLGPVDAQILDGEATDLTPPDAAALDAAAVDAAVVDAAVPDAGALDAQPLDQMVRLDGMLPDRGLVDAEVDGDAFRTDVAVAIDMQPRDMQPRDMQPVDMQPRDMLPVDMLPVDMLPIDMLPLDMLPVDAQLPDRGPPDMVLVDFEPADLGVADGGPDTGWSCFYNRLTVPNGSPCAEDREGCLATGVVECLADGERGSCSLENEPGQPCAIVAGACISEGLFVCKGEEIRCNAPILGATCAVAPDASDPTICPFEDGSFECVRGGGPLTCLPPEYDTEPNCDGVDDDCDGEVDERDPALFDRCTCNDQRCPVACVAGALNLDENLEGCERGCDVGVGNDPQLGVAGRSQVVAAGVLRDAAGVPIPAAVVTLASVTDVTGLGPRARFNLTVVTPSGELALPLNAPANSDATAHLLRALHATVENDMLLIGAVVEWSPADVRPYLWRVTWDATLRALTTIAPSSMLPAVVQATFAGFSLNHVTAFSDHGQPGLALVAYNQGQLRSKLVLMRISNQPFNSLEVVLFRADAANLDFTNRPVAIRALADASEYLVGFWRDVAGNAFKPTLRRLSTIADQPDVSQPLQFSNDGAPTASRIAFFQPLPGDPAAAFPVVVVPTTTGIRLHEGRLPVANQGSIELLASWATDLNGSVGLVLPWRTADQMTLAVSSTNAAGVAARTFLYPSLIQGPMPEAINRTYVLQAPYQLLLAVGQSSDREAAALVYGDGNFVRVRLIRCK